MPRNHDNTNTIKRYTHYYDINTNEPDWKLIWPQLTEEIPAIVEASGVEVTDHNGAEDNRHGEIYYCDFDEDQGEEIYRIIPFPSSTSTREFGSMGLETMRTTRGAASTRLLWRTRVGRLRDLCRLHTRRMTMW